MDSITKKAYGKINLGLDVVRRKSNGYHEVKMIMQTVSVYDELTFRKTQSKEIIIKVDAFDIPTDENNLIYKSAKLMMEHYPIDGGVEISLVKNIPVAAGMAGGSTDAATTFHGINELYELGASLQELQALGVKVGADVPYCLLGGTALAEGIGEILTPLCVPPKCTLLIAKPDIYVSTKFVYENLHLDEFTHHPNIDRLIESIKNRDVHEMADDMENVLEQVTISEYPKIEELKERMKDLGAIVSLMSGSGPTVFGIFDSEEKAKKAYNIFEHENLAKQLFLAHFVNE